MRTKLNLAIAGHKLLWFLPKIAMINVAKNMISLETAMIMSKNTLFSTFKSQ